ncbi:MAG: hypothetical protein G01um101418_833 [Parcubacteria group bacterium Gr01-1014_18]|nr:MAG: hypothetical protein Greene041636_787 [Parcubacteria group bacterium Greene0416_36]TSC80030.1 MAG: hypothetical protein G01um101418_833 [Parcubacteria group bacterium Gr01-1014_18]TSC98103.1 MAG: hypothetical protein Greene101420_874 [Parcubacteria group bacterium Greene1014_20]TSD06618.1 MAG: hypothetical protein Greene07142_757 [Parcubacteria group bacterium Greene0714_2]
MVRLDLKIPENISGKLKTDVVFAAWDDLFRRYNITGEEASIFVSINSDIYEKKAKISDLMATLQQKLKRSPEELKKIVRDIYLYVFSFSTDYLGVNFRELMKLIDPNDSAFFIEMEALNVLIEEELNPPPEEEITIEEDEITDEELETALTITDFEAEKKDLQIVFSTHLLDLLQTSDDVLKFLANIRLIQILSHYPLSELNNFITIISQNSERVTTNRIRLEGKEVEPTVANWIADFIKTMGLERLTSLKRAQYMGTSANAIKLTPEEKEKVNTVLEFYRLLRGFPQTFEGVPPERWFLIPIKGMEASKLQSVKEKAAKMKLGIGEEEAAPTGTVEKSLPKIEFKKPEQKPEQKSESTVKSAPAEAKKIEPQKAGSSVPAVREPIEKQVAVKKEEPKDLTLKSLVIRNKPAQSLVPAPSVGKGVLQYAPTLTSPTKPVTLAQKAQKAAALSEAEITAKYRGDERENQKVEEAMTRLVSLTGKRGKQLADYLFKSVSDSNPDKINVVAVLKLIAETNNLEEVIRDLRMTDLMKQSLGPKNLEEYLQNPLAISSLAKALRAILEVRVGLSADESSRIGLHLVNILRRNGNVTYANLARFNMARGKFEWAV